jgi:hypothetical protein
MNEQPCHLKPIEAPDKSPLPALECFRIIAWKACVYAEARWKLGPLYYCPTCELPEKDLKENCPKCPLTELYQSSFKKGAIREIERRGGLPEGLTIDKLISDFSTVSQLLGDNNGAIDKEWPVDFTALVRIVMQERDQHRFDIDWHDWKRMTST